MRRFLATLALCLAPFVAEAASVVWTCSIDTRGQLGSAGYFAVGGCTSDTGTCDTSQAAFTGATLCGSSTLTIKDVIVSSLAPDASGNGLAISYDHANNKIRCLGTAGGAGLLADNTATALITLSKFRFFAICQ